MNNFKKPSEQFKLTWYQNIYWAIKDYLNDYSLFYSSPRKAKKMWERDEKLVDQYEYSPNFLEDWRFIFTSLMHGLKTKGYWTMGVTEKNEHLKYMPGFVDSIKLNGFPNVKLITTDSDMLFVDLNMSQANKEEYKKLINVQNGNLQDNYERSKRNLERNAKILKSLN